MAHGGQACGLCRPGALAEAAQLPTAALRPEACGCRGQQGMPGLPHEPA